VFKGGLTIKKCVVDVKEGKSVHVLSIVDARFATCLRAASKLQPT
jgi:hypothetical protein